MEQNDDGIESRGYTTSTSSRSTPSIVEKKPAAVRYVEARRIGTCSFADQIATISIQHYKDHIDESIRINHLPQTCIATMVAAFHTTDVSSSSSSSSLSKISGTSSTISVSPKKDQKTTPQIIDLKVVAMGVGTKFLSEQILASEVDITSISSSSMSTALQYGTRIRDCHAEVLCRRAFRKYLFDCIEQLELSVSKDKSTTIHSSGSNICILERYIDPSVNGPPHPPMANIEDPQILQKYRVRLDVTLHMYCSSTPCGNSTIKKFATLQKEVFCTTLSEDTWPSNQQNHVNAPIIGHSIPLGQYALLVKNDNQQPTTTTISATTPLFDHSSTRVLSKKERSWPIYNTTEWCPPGTTTVWSNRGSIHTCSDKIARWNYLGYQGSLLSFYLHVPIYITTLTVGRKFSSVTCRRAICCRLQIDPKYTAKRYKRTTIENVKSNETIDSDLRDSAPVYHLHHPTVMGTGVYMDDTGVIEMPAVSPPFDDDKRSRSSDGDEYECTAIKSISCDTTISKSSGEVRFHSPMSFVTWLQQPSLRTTCGTNYETECIDGSTGYLFNCETSNRRQQQSKICSLALVKQFLKLESLRLGTSTPIKEFLMGINTLNDYRKLKRAVAAPYEQTKHNLLTKHAVLRDWKRRHTESDQDNNVKTIDIP